MAKLEPSQVDDLTGLLSRKAFLEKFPIELKRSKASEKEIPLSLVLIDVDLFSVINKSYGHIMGDNVLTAVADVLRTQAGEEAVIGRYGGDEFIIIFPGEEREQSFLKMERIRQELNRRELITPDENLVKDISISGGVAAFPLDGRTENELFRKADHALYRAKAAGRNQIRLAYEERMVPKTTHYTQTQLERLTKLAEARGVSEADLLREAMDDFLTKYGVNDIET
jgi:diguanylate cyclase (GGDEF)-like protein